MFMFDFNPAAFIGPINLTSRGMDLPPDLVAVDYQPQYKYRDEPRIKRAVDALYKKQGLVPRASINRALNECIADLRKALFEQDRFLTEVDCEKWESWMIVRKPLIGRLHIFATERNETSEIIEELRDSYDFETRTFNKRTIERLIETVLLGKLEGVAPIQ